MKVVIAMKIVIHKVTGRSDSSEDEESEMCSTFMGLQPYQKSGFNMVSLN